MRTGEPVMILWWCRTVEICGGRVLARDWGNGYTATVTWERGDIEPIRNSGWTMLPCGVTGKLPAFP